MPLDKWVKDGVFNNWCYNNHLSTWQKMKLGAYTLSININYRFIEELNMKGKLSREYNFYHFDVRKDFLNKMQNSDTSVYHITL